MIRETREEQASVITDAEPVLLPLKDAEFSLELPGRIRIADIDLFGNTFGETADPIPPGPKVAFKVLGTDLAVSGVSDLAAKLQGKWTPPQARTLDQVESALERIRNGRFGTCERCDGPIARPRLEAMAASGLDLRTHSASTGR